MRGLSVLVVSLLVVGALAGCVNTKKDPPTNATLPATTPGAIVEAKPVRVLAPLTSTVSTDSPKWVKPGAMVNVTATAPAGAKGAVTYSWSVGAMPGTVIVTPGALDTGSKTGAEYIPAGGTDAITFPAAGVFQMHCHPHPWMRANVTVVEGYKGPANVDVYIVDGDKPDQYVYAPQNVIIPVGGKVTYINKGLQPHTATLYAQDAPALKLLPLDKSSGQVALAGPGWQRVRMVTMDGEGRFGNATLDFYVAELPAFATVKFDITNQLGGAPEQVQSPQSKSFVTDYNGTMTVKYAFKDGPAGSGAPVNNAKVEIHVKQAGAAQDALTDSGKAEGTITGLVPADSYSITVIVTEGIAVSGSITIDVEYDLSNPPAPVLASAGGGDGGHHH